MKIHFNQGKLVAIIAILFFICCKDRDKKSLNGIITVNGSLAHATNESSYVVFNRFFDNDPENYFFMYDSVPVNDYKFNLSFEVQGTGIISIHPNDIVPKIYLICDRDGDIGLSVKRNSNNTYTVNFKGKNAEGQTLFFESSLFRVNELSEIIQNEVTKNKMTSENMIQRIEQVQDSLFHPFDELLKTDRITSSFYDIAKKQAEIKILSAVDHVTSHSNRYSNGNLIDQGAFNEVLIHYFNKYDPFSDHYKYIDMVARTVNAEAKCRLISKGVLRGNLNDLGIWDKRLDFNNYAPPIIQEKIKAIKIMFNRSFQLNPLCDDKKEFLKFKEVFPNSGYNDLFFNTYFSGVDCSGAQGDTIAQYPLIAFEENDSPKTTYYKQNSLDSLLAKEFNGKYVFVDLWATWCAPCIKEFSYVAMLHQLLDDMGVEMLYVSVDAISAEENWKKAILKHRLFGQNFLTTNSILDNLKNILGENEEVAIPRYMLFDGNGVLLDGNLPRPSTDKLKTRLQELLHENEKSKEKDI